MAEAAPRAADSAVAAGSPSREVETTARTAAMARSLAGASTFVSKRSDGAREFYATDDVYARRNVEQFFGIEAEWWFNSSYR